MADAILALPSAFNAFSSARSLLTITICPSSPAAVAVAFAVVLTSSTGVVVGVVVVVVVVVEEVSVGGAVGAEVGKAVDRVAGSAVVVVALQKL